MSTEGEAPIETRLPENIASWYKLHLQIYAPSGEYLGRDLGKMKEVPILKFSKFGIVALALDFFSKTQGLFIGMWCVGTGYYLIRKFLSFNEEILIKSDTS